MLPVCKYHGCGNDFIIMKYIHLNEHMLSEFIKEICDRNCGIGADGLILVKTEPLEMLFYNCDGSRASMCGNGIRCFVKYCYDEGICQKLSYDVKTLAGIQKIKIQSLHPFMVCVDMGIPELNPRNLHLLCDDPLLNYPFYMDAIEYRISSVFIGTIHTVLFVSDIKSLDKEKLGKAISGSAYFQEGTNVNFAQVIDSKTIRVCTYERGAGLTLACGTGSCAAAWFAHRNGWCNANVRVLLEKGELNISLKEHVFMTGPAEFIMKGMYDYHNENLLIDHIMQNQSENNI